VTVGTLGCGAGTQLACAAPDGLGTITPDHDQDLALPTIAVAIRSRPQHDEPVDQTTDGPVSASTRSRKPMPAGQAADAPDRVVAAGAMP